MRHALALSAILLSAAAASEEQVYYKITLTNGTLSIAPGPAAAGRNDGRLQQIELQSLKWAVPDAKPAASEGMRKDLQAADKLGNAPAAGGHSMLGASDKVTAGGSQTETAQATGKRVHKPLRARMYYDQAQGTGPGILKINARYPGCTVGKRYGGMQFAAGGKTYRLQGVTVESCGGGTSAAPTEQIIFVYGKLDIR